MSLGSLVLLAARRAAAEGRSRQAAQSIPDVCQYGRDVAYAQGHYGMVVLERGFSELRTHLISGRFDPESLHLLEGGLQTSDGSFPSVDREHLRGART